MVHTVCRPFVVCGRNVFEFIHATFLRGTVQYVRPWTVVRYMKLPCTISEGYPRAMNNCIIPMLARLSLPQTPIKQQPVLHHPLVAIYLCMPSMLPHMALTSWLLRVGIHSQGSQNVALKWKYCLLHVVP